jgi:hypothetical protein
MQILQVLKIIPVKIWIIGALVIFLGLSAYQTFIGDRKVGSVETVSPQPLASYESPSPAASQTASSVPTASPKASVKPSASVKASASVSPVASSSPAPSTSSNSNSNNSGVVLNGIDPSNPAFGTTMTLKGSGFGSSQGVYGVYYNGQPQPYGGIQSWSDTEIKTSSPFFVTGAEYQLEVQTADGKKSNRITVKSGDGQPAIESFSPSNAKPSQELVLKGSRFGGQGQVNFFLNYPNISGSGQIISWTDSEIHLTIPSNLEAGKEYGIEVVSGGGGHSSFKYYTLGS